MSQSEVDINLNLSEAMSQVVPRKPVFVRPLIKEEITCARLEARNPNWSDSELVTYMNKPLSWLTEIREHPEYQAIVTSIKEESRKKHLSSGGKVIKGDIEALFDAEIEKSISTLVCIRDNPAEKSTDRLKAVQMIFDYAPKVPNKKSEQAAPNIILNIPYQQVETLRQVSNEVGMPDLLDMLEGEDYTSSIENGG